jgi:hypothetical protein
MKRFIASLLLVTVPIIGYSAPASAYGRATMYNRTNYAVHGTIHYAGCRADNFAIAAGPVGKNSVITETHFTISAYRGACLITRITATVNGKAATAYTSSGTGYERFIVAASNGGYKVDSLANMQKEVADATGGPGFRIINNTNYPVEVSLDQVACLYYGVVTPGQAFDRTTGAVWFTVTAQQQMDTVEHRTLSSCVLPVALIVGTIVIGALTAGVGAAMAAPAAGTAAAALAPIITSTTVTVTAATITGAAGATGASTLAASAVGAAMKPNGQGELKGQYAGPPWPFRCSVKPTYTITGGWGKTTKDKDGNVVIPLGTPIQITKTNTCGNSMMN